MAKAKIIICGSLKIISHDSNKVDIEERKP